MQTDSTIVEHVSSCNFSFAMKNNYQKHSQFCLLMYFIVISIVLFLFFCIYKMNIMFQFQKLEILWWIRCNYILAGNSLRNVFHSLKLIEIEVSHQTIYNWEEKYSSLMAKCLEKILHLKSQQHGEQARFISRLKAIQNIINL